MRGQAQIVGDEDKPGIVRLLQAADQRHDMRLGGDVERGRRLVGDDEGGIAGEGHGDEDALAHAARKLERIALEELVGRRQPHLLERARRRGRRRSAGATPSRARCSANWRPIVSTGLSAESGSCGTKAMRSPSSARRRAGVSASRSSPWNASRRAASREAGRQKLRDHPARSCSCRRRIRRRARECVPAPGSSRCRAAPRPRARRSRHGNVEPGDLEQHQRTTAKRCARRGSRLRRSPSPRRLAASTAQKMARTGAIRPVAPRTWRGARRRSSRPRRERWARPRARRRTGSPRPRWRCPSRC